MLIWWQAFITFLSNVGLWLLGKEQAAEVKKDAPKKEVIDGINTADDSKVVDGLNKLRERKKK